MKKKSIMLLFLMPLLALAERVTPIEGGRLASALNGNQKAITNLQYVQVGTTTVNQVFLNSLLHEVVDYGPRVALLEARSNDWTSAYNWGNHATVGYLTEYTETDPTIPATPDEPETKFLDGNKQWTSIVVPDYDNTQIRTVSSNLFVKITNTNLVLYEIATVNDESNVIFSFSTNATIYGKIPPSVIVPWDPNAEATWKTNEAGDVFSYWASFEDIRIDYWNDGFQTEGWEGIYMEPPCTIPIFESSQGATTGECYIAYVQYVATNAIRTFLSVEEFSNYLKQILTNGIISSIVLTNDVSSVSSKNFIDYEEMIQGFHLSKNGVQGRSTFGTPTGVTGGTPWYLGKEGIHFENLDKYFDVSSSIKMGVNGEVYAEYGKDFIKSLWIDPITYELYTNTWNFKRTDHGTFDIVAMPDVSNYVQQALTNVGNGFVASVDGVATSLSINGTFTLNGSGIWIPLSQTTNALGKIVTITETNTLGGAVRTNFFSASSGCRIPKTGQRTSFVTGDDGYWKAGLAWPVPRFSIVGADGTAETNKVRDNLTGLEISREWNFIAGGTNWTAAIHYITNTLNVVGYGGATDWRLPTLPEALSLINYQYESPCLSNTAGTGQHTTGNPFFGVLNGYYWSATTRMGASTLGYVFNTTFPRSEQQAKTANIPFFAVRASSNP